MTGLDALLAASDFVSMHVPDTAETMGMLDEARIAAMKPGAYLVNVTNSSVADRAALAAALAEGRLAGAALDVHEAHPIPPDSPFIGLPNVLLTPHIGGATQETIERHSMVAMVARGEQPLPRTSSVSLELGEQPLRLRSTPVRTCGGGGGIS